MTKEKILNNLLFLNHKLILEILEENSEGLNVVQVFDRFKEKRAMTRESLKGLLRRMQLAGLVVAERKACPCCSARSLRYSLGRKL